MIGRAAVLAAMVALTGCVALSDNRQFEHRTTSFGEQQRLGAARPEACKIYVVPEVPRGKRLGSILVPAALAAEQRIDDDSREYACGLCARFAVKEEESTDKDGQPIWRLGLYPE